MTQQEITKELLYVGIRSINYDSLLIALGSLKEKSIQENSEEKAKEIWVLEQIAEIQQGYQIIFNALKSREYYEAWCDLERLEIKFQGLKKHFSYNEEEYKLAFIEKCITNLQAIYPYSLFFSSEIVELEKKCNICNKVLSVRNPCNHKVGEIYKGEYCLRIISDFKVIGVAIVNNPVHKYSVAFFKDETTGDTKDQYNYVAIDYLMNRLNSTFEDWDLEIEYKFIPHEYFSGYGTDDFCPCNSGDKYNECCLSNPGVRHLNYEFIVKNPSDLKVLTNTIK